MARVTRKPKKDIWEEDFPPHHVWKQRKKRQQEELDAILEKEEEDGDNTKDPVV